MRALVLSVLLCVGCSGDDDDGGDDVGDAPSGADAPAGGADGSPADSGGGAFTLTSSVLLEGQMFPDRHTCDDVDVSPPLEWSGAPQGTQSYAIVLRDLDFMSGFIHWVIWDIPASTIALPEGVPNDPEPAPPVGAKQCLSYDDSTYGYRGPCSPASVNTYEFTVYALDVDTLPGVTTDSAREDVVGAILMHDVASTTLSGEH